MTVLPRFTAPVITGAGRGRRIGTPTLNVDLTAVPADLGDGIYAVQASWAGGGSFAAVMHLGPRPVFQDSRSCEVHLLDAVPPADTQTVSVTVVARLRDVQNFPSPEALVAQIQRDIAAARAILAA